MIPAPRTGVDHDRRRLLAALVGSPILVAVGTSGCTDSTSDPGEAAVRAVGERYRAAVPQENDQEKLMGLLDLPAESPFGMAGLESLNPMIDRDFVANRTVTLDGWMLSRTECRAAALFSLL